MDKYDEKKWVQWPKAGEPIFSYNELNCVNQWDDTDNGCVVFDIKTEIDLYDTGTNELIQKGTAFDNVYIDVTTLKLMFTNDLNDKVLCTFLKIVTD